MDVPNFRDWFNVGAIVPLFAVLFSSSFGLFEAPAMSPQAEFVWIMGIIVMAFLVWFNAAKGQQREREVRIILDDIKQLLAEPGTTLEDVKMAIGVTARASAVSSSMRGQAETIKAAGNGLK